MRLLRVPTSLARVADGARHTLDADAARYVTRVHRRGPGAPLVLFDPELALEADATLLGGTDVSVERLRAAEVETRRAVLLQSLAKGDKVDAVVRDATELGAVELRVFPAARSIGQASFARRERWERVAIQAARQCGRADRLRVVPAASLDEATRSLEPGALRVLLDPTAAVSLGALLRERPASLVAAVGPEGGFDEGERALLAERGFEAARLGRWVHRTETSVAALLGAWLAAD